ncbi:hypothetical protein BSBH6_00382 [Bacillus subtilis]|nr:hypothetical protein BSBH6_00382 [Bacillus subtilis]RPK26745.1 hypothetical protein BH5_00380 [Bacillus subtilis]
MEKGPAKKTGLFFVPRVTSFRMAGKILWALDHHSQATI